MHTNPTTYQKRIISHERSVLSRRDFRVYNTYGIHNALLLPKDHSSSTYQDLISLHDFPSMAPDRTARRDKYRVSPAAFYLYSPLPTRRAASSKTTYTSSPTATQRKSHGATFHHSLFFEQTSRPAIHTTVLLPTQSLSFS